MLKLFFMLLLIVVSNTAMAQWIKVFTSDDNTSVFYAAPSSKQDTGAETAKIWVLNDLNKEQLIDSKSYLSIISEKEYNCKDMQDRLLYSSYHTGNMGGREVVQSGSDNKQWAVIKPNTPGAAQWEIACHSVVVHQNH